MRKLSVNKQDGAVFFGDDQPSWMDNWLLVDVLTISEAASLLCGEHPTYDHSTNRSINALAMEKAITVAITMGRITPLVAYTLSDWRDEDVHEIEVEKIDFRTSLANCTRIDIQELAAWAESKGRRHCWEGMFEQGLTEPEPVLDEQSGDVVQTEALPRELQVALDAFRAIHGNEEALSARSPRAALSEWIKQNHPGVGSEARNRIATVANWKPKGGAPKTPSRRS